MSTPAVVVSSRHEITLILGVEARAFDVLMSELDKINQSTSTGYIFVIGT